MSDREMEESEPHVEPMAEEEAQEVEGGLLMPWHGEYWRMWRYVFR